MNKQLQKVISGLEHHSGIADVGCWRVEGTEINPACPYYDDEDNGEPACGTKVLMDAIELLKAYDFAWKQFKETLEEIIENNDGDVREICTFLFNLMRVKEIDIQEGKYI